MFGSGGGWISEHLELSHGREGILQAREGRPCRTRLGEYSGVAGPMDPCLLAHLTRSDWKGVECNILPFWYKLDISHMSILM